MEPTLKSLHARIAERRDALQAQFDAAEREYNELERAMQLLDRQLCAMRGGLAELDALLSADPPIRDERDMLMSRLGEAHQTLDVMEGNGNGIHAAD